MKLIAYTVVCPFLLIALLTDPVCYAQQSFDIVSYSLPSGWQQQISSDQLVLQKKTDAKNPCRITISPSTVSSGNGEKDFRAQWKKYVQDIYAATADSLLIETQQDGEWTTYSANSYIRINGVELVCAFTTVVGRKVIISINAITPDNACLEEINTFLSDMEFEAEATPGHNTSTTTRKKGVIKKKRIKFRPGKASKDGAT